MCLLSPVSSCEIDRLLRALMEENPELQNEIEHLSRLWIAEVMNQPSKSNKGQKRSFDYSKSKIANVLKWRQNNGFLLAEVERRVELQGNPMQTTYLKEFNTGCFYWYGTDAHGCPNLWFREEVLGWENVDLQSRIAYSSLVLQSAINNMPPHIHRLNFILLLDKLNPVNALKHPRLGPHFLQTFMKCCPDRLKQAVMVAGTTGRIFYNMTKALAPKSLVDKIEVFNDRRTAGRFMIKKKILHCVHSRICTMSSEETTDDLLIEDLLLPSFLGGSLKHDEDIAKNLPLMLAELSKGMNSSVSDISAT